MGRIPLPATGNPKLDMVIRLIDEQLSELYSQHGTQTPRASVDAGTITLRDDLGPGARLSYGTLFRDMQCIGMGWSDVDGKLYFSKNIEAHDGSSVSRVGTGDYLYRFKSGTVRETIAGYPQYVVIPNTGNSFLAGVVGIVISATIDQNYFRIQTGNSNTFAASDSQHSFICFGQLKEVGAT